MAYAPSAQADQILAEKQARDLETIDRTDALADARENTETGADESFAMAEQLSGQAKALERRRGTFADREGALDKFKHALGWLLGRNADAVSNFSKKRLGQDWLQASGDRDDEANDDEIADLKRQAHFAEVQGQQMARLHPPKPEVEQDTETAKGDRDSRYREMVLLDGERAARRHTTGRPAQNFARLVSARDGAADSARLAGLSREDHERRIHTDGIDQLRSDMNRNHREAAATAGRKNFSRT